MTQYEEKSAGQRTSPGPQCQVNCSRQHFSLHYGFTPIELLVIIAILAILTALLLPVLARPRRRRKQRSV
jgi:type II secretory pathway pseudopilin PulG